MGSSCYGCTPHLPHQKPMNKKEQGKGTSNNSKNFEEGFPILKKGDISPPSRKNSIYIWQKRVKGLGMNKEWQEVKEVLEPMVLRWGGHKKERALIWLTGAIRG